MIGPDAIRIVCTGGGTHRPRQLGRVDVAGVVFTKGGDKDRRQPSPRGHGPNIHPEPCPKCPRNRNYRRTREDWQKIVAEKHAAGESYVDISI
jgi:hypothetical protein